MNSIWQKIIRTDNNAAAAILRLTLGLVMFPHGAQKMMGWFGGNGFAGTMDFFTGVMGIPALFAFLAIVTEFFGSLFLIAGALTRVWALGMTILMAVAAWMNHLQHGFFMNWMGQQAGEGFEYHLLVIGLSIGLILLGAGKWSVDRAITRQVY